MSSFITGLTAWVASFIIGAKLLHTPGSEYWGLLFIMVCGFALGILVHRFADRAKAGYE